MMLLIPKFVCNFSFKVIDYWFTSFSQASCSQYLKDWVRWFFPALALYLKNRFHCFLFESLKLHLPMTLLAYTFFVACFMAPFLLAYMRLYLLLVINGFAKREWSWNLHQWNTLTLRCQRTYGVRFSTAFLFCYFFSHFKLALESGTELSQFCFKCWVKES